jgi:hypothetical protein
VDPVTVEFDEDGRRVLTAPLAAPVSAPTTIIPPLATRAVAPPPVLRPRPTNFPRRPAHYDYMDRLDAAQPKLTPPPVVRSTKPLPPPSRQAATVTADRRSNAIAAQAPRPRRTYDGSMGITPEDIPC